MALKEGKHREWHVAPSDAATRVLNPIRAIVDDMKVEPHPEKQLIRLSVGDPSVFGNLDPSEEIIEEVKKSLLSNKFNGYQPSHGSLNARSAVADFFSNSNVKYSEDDVIMTSGCSHAIDLIITTLVNPGENILIPRPTFSIYRTIARTYNIGINQYNLLPDLQWKVDLDDMEQRIDENTKLIVVNNPSNPCGSVYTKEHLNRICDVARRHKLPILADEVYNDLVYSTNTFHAMGELCQDVPVLSANGLTKKWLVPGWRLGWILVADRANALATVRPRLRVMSQRILGPNSFVENALPAIFSNVPREHFNRTIGILEANATTCYGKLQAVPGLAPVMPQGAMYMLVGIQLDRFPFTDDRQFTEELIKQASVFCLPGTCFDYANYFRVVIAVPSGILIEACDRIAEFCGRHCNVDGRLGM